MNGVTLMLWYTVSALESACLGCISTIESDVSLLYSYYILYLNKYIVFIYMCLYIEHLSVFPVAGKIIIYKTLV